MITYFNGKTFKSDKLIVLNLEVGNVTKTTMFIVVPSKNYNLLLIREWMDAIGDFPLMVYQKMFFRDDNGNSEEIIICNFLLELLVLTFCTKIRFGKVSANSKLCIT